MIKNGAVGNRRFCQFRYKQGQRGELGERDVAVKRA